MLAILLSIAIASCGGGGGSSPGSTTQTLTGTAATGLPLAATTITIKDVNGITKTGTTTANGGYTVDVTGMTLPFLLQVPSGAGNLYSVATATGTANIHPFTDLIIRNWYIAHGTTVDAVFSGSAPLLMPSITEINAIELVVRNILSTWLTNVGLPSTFNLITTPFVANSSGFDKVLDNTTVAIDATGNVTITTPDPNNPGTSITIVSTPITQLTTLDTILPTNPAGLLATPANTTSIALQWNISTDNVGVVGYNIYRGGSKIGSSPYPVYSDTGLAPGTLYSYTVKALDGALNESAASNTATATTLSGASVSQFDGTYIGSDSGTLVPPCSPGCSDSFIVQFTVANGVVSTVDNTTGVVSASGSINFMAGSLCGGGGAIVPYDTMIGQITISSTGVATVSGTSSAPQVGTPPNMCNARTGTWTATRP